MPAIARTRPFEGCRYSLRPAGFQECGRIPPPGVSVEVGSEEPATVVAQHGIDAERMAPAQMPGDRLVRDRQESLIGACNALDARLPAEARRPLIGTDRRIAGLARPGVLPALRVDILAADEQRSEQ